MRSNLVFLFLILIGCAGQPSLNQIELEQLNGSAGQISPVQNALTVVFFLSPECPLCINYTLTMKELADEFQNDSVVFYGIHAGEWFTAKEVADYVSKYDLPITMFLDHGNQLAKALGATVTPEVFVLDSKSEILYRGKIDNWVNDLGKKKLEVSERYLHNALVAWRTDTEINPKRTEPKGCLIE